MYKISPLNVNISGLPVVIAQEEINLGNSNTMSVIFRKHIITVIRPDVIGMGSELTLENAIPKKGLLNGIKSKLTPKPKLDFNSFVDIEAIPEFVLINPSEWGDITKKNIDGTNNERNTGEDKLISLKTLIGYQKDITISVNLKLKESNVI